MRSREIENLIVCERGRERESEVMGETANKYIQTERATLKLQFYSPPANTQLLHTTQKKHSNGDITHRRLQVAMVATESL